MSENSTTETTRQTINRLRARKAAMAAPKRNSRPVNNTFQIAFSVNANPPRPGWPSEARKRPVKCLNSQHGGGAVVYESLVAAGNAEGIADSTMSNAFAKARKGGRSVATAKGRRFEYV